MEKEDMLAKLKEFERNHKYDFTKFGAKVGAINVDYATLVEVFGKPDPELCLCEKTDASWAVDTMDTDGSKRYISIYNWKDGPNYLGKEEGTPVSEITKWMVGGKDEGDVEKILDIIGISLLLSKWMDTTDE